MKICLFLFNSMSPFSRKKVYGGEISMGSNVTAIADHVLEKEILMYGSNGYNTAFVPLT
jgi:hypothetical protein